MSQIPRRTSEFQVGSAKRPTRSSRVTNSALRPSSSTQYNRISTAASNARQSTAASRILATPMRTPAKTPTASRDRMTIVQMTAEKEKAPIDDKDYIHGKSHQILQELSKQHQFDELVQKGLKSMTLKNFIAILEFFIKPICGSVPSDFQTSYVDFLYNLLIQLEYPFNINKSSLKTPNAPHCFNNVIVLLGWLADFSKIDDEDIQYKTTDEFPDIETMKIYMEQTSEAYKLFNDVKDYSHIEKKIRDTYMEMRIGAGSDAYSEKEKLQYEIEQLNKESKPLSLLKELNEKKEESKILDDKIKSHNNNIGEYNRKIENLKTTLDSKQQLLYRVQKELKSLDSQLKAQKMNLETRQQYLLEIVKVKSALMSKRNAAIELMEASSENEIMLSNLIYKKFQLTDRLNNLLYKISSDLDVVGTNKSDEFNPEMYEIKTNDEMDMDKMIHKIQKGLIELKNKYYQMQSEMKEKIMKMDSEMHRYKTENEVSGIKHQQLLKSMQKATDDETEVEDTLSILIHSIQVDFNERNEKIKENEKLIMDRTKGIEKLEEEIKDLADKRKAFGSKAVDECEKLYLEKKNEIESRRRYLKEGIEMIDNYHQNKLQIPSDLLPLIESFKKKINEKKR